MDFFEQQDRARRKSLLLVGLFLLATLLIILAVYGIFALLSLCMADSSQPLSLWNPPLFVGVMTITLLVVAGGSVYKIIALARGGAALAARLGARRLQPDSALGAERRLLNVVEEMAIASGIPVPRVFILEQENSINAFAAGFSSADVVIGVTNGCLLSLTRAELQGVIAHEFSHILNGDMRLNLRLLGVLHGILVIALIGYTLLRLAAYSATSRTVGKQQKQNAGASFLFLLLGLSLLAIGYIGVFFAKLIKSAVSRQREFLADAAAVQFTRNPAGLGNALKKIAGFKYGSQILHPRAEEFSHLFFANGLRPAWLNLLATHPPLAERIRRIDPSGAELLAEFPSSQTPAELRDDLDYDQMAPDDLALAGLVSRPATQSQPQLRSQGFLQSIGRPQLKHLAYAERLLAAIPADLRQLARQTPGACALLYGLLLGPQPDLLVQQLNYLRQHSDVYQTIKSIWPSLASLAAELRWPLLDLTLPALASLSPSQWLELKNNLNHLIAADASMTLFEYALLQTVLRQMKAILDPQKKAVVKYHAWPALRPAARRLLSALAYYGQPASSAAALAFQQAAAKLDLAIDILPPNQCGLQSAYQAIKTLQAAAAPLKKIILEACLACVEADGQITLAEAHLLRAVAAALDCPMPPLLAP